MSGCYLASVVKKRAGWGARHRLRELTRAAVSTVSEELKHRYFRG